MVKATNIMKFVILITVFITIKCDSLLIENLAHSINPLSLAAAEIVKDFYSTKGSYFHINRAVVEENRYLLDEIITELLRYLEFTNLSTMIEVNHELNSELKNFKRFSVLIFIDSIESFNRFFSLFSPSNFNLRRHFTIIALKELQHHDLRMIFDALWTRSVKKVNIICMNSSGTIELITFFPFTKDSCRNIEPIKISIFNLKLLTWTNKKFYPYKTKNLHKCSLKIGCAVGTGEPYTLAREDSKGNIEVQGIEREIMTDVSKLLNFEPKFEMHGTFPGLLYENGTATGAFT